jgi:hypothetical protein
MAFTPPIITFKKAAHYTEGRSEPVRAIVNHRMVGTLLGTDGYFTNPATRNVSTHFGVGMRNGKVAVTQYVPLDDTAYGNGNYDPSGQWDDWGYKVTEVNAQTINIEHEDNGNSANILIKGIVTPEIQEASQWLQALILRAVKTEWQKYGIIVRDWTGNFPILQKELRVINPSDHTLITHHDIAGKLKPYCWMPWAGDKVGYPRSKYVTAVKARLQNADAIIPAPVVVPPPVVVVPPPTEPTYTKTQLDAIVASKVFDAVVAERAKQGDWIRRNNQNKATIRANILLAATNLQRETNRLNDLAASDLLKAEV